MSTLREIFKHSEDGFPNYRATFARIDATFPIEGADRLVRAIVCGRDVVISKDLPLSNIYIYIPIESSLSHKYLSKNNLYRISSDSYQLNDNFEEVNKHLMIEGQSLSELSKMGGFFEKNGRVKQIRIRGVYSQGYLADVQSLINAYPILDQYMIDEFEELEGVTFDVIGDEVFCEKYLIGGKKPVEQKVNDQKHYQQRSKNLRKASVLVKDQFKYHYDTAHFEDHYKKFRPTDDVTISVKVHGSSGIFANVLCYKMPGDSKFKKFLYGIFRPKEYRLLYASRTKIRNEKVYDTPRQSNYFYGNDIWAPVRDMLADHIEKGMIVYGEIVGYVAGTTKMIQKGHDYGCAPGEWKFMPYRIVQVNRRGKRREWNLAEVANWTDDLRVHLAIAHKHQGVKHLMTVPILYDGPLGNLYPDLNYDDENWNLNLLERMKSDQKFLGMELQEPLCKMKAPREGVVIRINDDEYARAWKLKTKAHEEMNKKSKDAGEHDMEEES
jgi:hypothetical protein